MLTEVENLISYWLNHVAIYMYNNSDRRSKNYPYLQNMKSILLCNFIPNCISYPSEHLYWSFSNVQIYLYGISNLVKPQLRW